MPKCSIIIMHQLDCNQKYLELAYRGVREQTFTDFELIVVSGAETRMREHPEGQYRTHWDPCLDTATKKIHWGIENSTGEFILLHSDDVVLSRDSLGEMVTASESVDCIMNPFSNSDCRSVYHADFGITKGTGPEKQSIQLIHDMNFETLAGWEDELLSFPLGRRIFLPVPAVSFYCTMFRRSTWEKVGELDPLLEYRHNDQDFCIRAKDLGIPALVNFAPFAFHFGSRTLSHLATDEIKSRATAHFLAKHYQKPSP